MSAVPPRAQAHCRALPPLQLVRRHDVTGLQLTLAMPVLLVRCTVASIGDWPTADPLCARSVGSLQSGQRVPLRTPREPLPAPVQADPGEPPESPLVQR